MKFDEETMCKTFAARLEHVMELRGYTVHRCSKKICVHPETFYKWLRGHNMPNSYYVVELANLLKVSTDYLYGLREDMDYGE